jgi:hypothetical protein
MATALDHREPDRVPVDLGGTAVTGISAAVLSRLRLALGLDEPGERVRVTEPYQMLGQVTDDLREALGIDTVGLGARNNLFGYESCDWKPWNMPDGTPVLVPGAFHTEPEADGSILQYPGGDTSVPASGRMPKGGYYFDTIIRQEPIDEDNLNVEDNLEEFGVVSDADLQRFDDLSRDLCENTPWSMVANFGGTGFGDIAMVPAPFLKHPRGIRDVAEWYMSLVARKEYIHELFGRQCEIALGNLERIHARVGERVQVVFMTGTDFGTQRGPLASPASYREMFQPYHRVLNDWVHAHTTWKCFLHTCGGVLPLIPDFIEAGFDILNPVQCSAEGMSAQGLKAEFGQALTFWGGAVDTQKTLPFGTPEEVRREVLARLEVFAPGGGFVFNAIHNIQPRTPVQNLQAMFRAYREFHGE